MFNNNNKNRLLGVRQMVKIKRKYGYIKIKGPKTIRLLEF